MPKFTITINDISGGIAPTQYLAAENQYNFSLGIDPDFAIADSGAAGVRSSGILRPTAYETFDSTNLTGNPYWILTNPKNTNVYVYTDNGRLVRYSSGLTAASEVLDTTATASSGNGAAYYNNYIYMAKNTDIARWGPLDGTPAVTQDFWVTTLSLTALANTNYPLMRGAGRYPNHPMHVHVDNRLYIGDYDSATTTAATRGRGLIHWIRTTYGTAEGSANDGSTYNALDLPLGYMPTDIESYGTDLVIACIQGSDDTTIIQGKARLLFWKFGEDTFYREVPLEDPLVTALLYTNGTLYIWSGNSGAATGVGNGYRLSMYLGENKVKTLWTCEEGFSPPAGAVDALRSRIIWGSNVSYPASTAVVFAYGSHNEALPKAVHGIASVADGMITALKYVEHASGSLPRPVLGFRNETANSAAADVAMYKISTTYGTSYWRSRVYNIGQPFDIKRVYIPLGVAAAANTSITPTIYVDELSSSTALSTINNTTLANSERNYESRTTVSGRHNFLLELQWTGTALFPVTLPITIEGETKSGL